MVDDDYVRKIKFSHIALLDALDLLKVSAHSYTEAKPRIRDLQEKLLGHFTLQRDDFYDEIGKYYQGDESKQKILDGMVLQLRDLKVHALTFFDEYPADMGDLRPHNFNLNLKVFADDCQARIMMEEKYLVPFMEEMLA